jgi:LysR family nitrogen assimilation transcriptional regulator
VHRLAMADTFPGGDWVAWCESCGISRMDLRQISYFMWVYEEKSFSKASARADVVQSVLSTQIRRLENEFGIKLFERQPRGVVPTEAGRRFYERCTAINQNVAIARDELIAASDQTRLSGLVRVGLPGTFNRAVLRNVLVPFLEDHPDVEMSITEGYTGTLVDWVREGKVDFALGIRPAEESGLIQKLFYRDQLVLVSGSPLCGPSLTVCDVTKLRDLKLIVHAASHSVGAELRACIEAKEIDVARMLEINGTVGSIDLATTSDWSLICPFMSVIREVGQHNVYIYPVQKPAITFELYLVYDRRRPLNLAARAFLSTLKDELRSIDIMKRELGIIEVKPV